MLKNSQNNQGLGTHNTQEFKTFKGMKSEAIEDFEDQNSADEMDGRRF